MELLSDITSPLVDILMQPVTAAIIGLVLITLITTRTIISSPPKDEKSQAPPSHPYWIPVLGHLPSMVFSSFLPSLREKYRPDGLFSLNFFSQTHTIVTNPAFAGQLIGASPHTADVEWMYYRITQNAFGYSGTFDRYRRTFYTPGDPPYKHITSDPGMKEVVEETIRCLKLNAPDLVSFNSYEVDQMAWERLAGAEVLDRSEDAGNEPVMEVDLMVLIKNFVAITSSSSIWGTDFVENFSSELWQPFWTFDEHFQTLAAGLPFWLPLPGVQRGKAAWRRVRNCLREFNEQMDKWAAGEDTDAKWQNLDNVGRMIKWRVAKYREVGMDMNNRAAMDTALLWGANANSKPAVNWLLVECYRDPVILERVREEILPFVQVEQPQNEFHLGVWVPPDVKKLDLDGLMNHCPLLKSMYVEVLRFYTHSWSVRWMNDDLVLKDKKGASEGGGGVYTLRKGTYAHAPQELHQFDDKFFDRPHEFRADRHIVEKVGDNGEKRIVVELGTIKPYGGGPASCKGRAVAAREILLYAAVIVSMWEMEMPKGKSWGDIKTAKSTGGKVPTKPLKVWIRRRKLPTAGASAT